VADNLKAMKEGRKDDASILRLVLAAIINQDKATGSPASEEDVTKILRKQVKQCHEAAEAFHKGQRVEQAKIEESQATLLEGYLPKEPSQEELETLVRRLIEKTGAMGEKEIGKVMGAAMKELRGRVDGNKVRQIVSGMLNREGQN